MIMMALIEIQKRVSTGNTKLSTFLFQHHCLHQKTAKDFSYINCAHSVQRGRDSCQHLPVLAFRIHPKMKSVAVDWQNRMFSPGTPSFFKTLIFVLLLHVILLCFRALRFAKIKKDGTRSFICGATLITSLHALTAFHCLDSFEFGTADEAPCIKTDFSKGDIGAVRV